LCHPIRNEIPLRPFAKGSWGDFDAETSVESSACLLPFSREKVSLFSVAGLLPATEK
jgi:hypothetical protein